MTCNGCDACSQGRRVTSADVQAQAVLAGRRPSDDLDTGGYDAHEHWGTLATGAGEELVPSEQGRYHDLYAQFAAAVRGEAVEPVPAAEGGRTLAVLDAARLSAERGRMVELDGADRSRGPARAGGEDQVRA